MILNNDPALIVREYRNDNTERTHRVLAWTAKAEPLIVGLHGLEVPKFRAWALDDEAMDRDDTERRVRRALAGDRVGVRK